MKPCTLCGVVTSRAGSRCTDHARQSNRSRHNALYITRGWQRLSARVLRVWRGEHGHWYLGYLRPAHRASDLTVGHVVPLAAGGAPVDIANTAVLSRSCNSSKGAATDRGGVAHAARRIPPDRAFPCVHAPGFPNHPCPRDVRPRAPLRVTTEGPSLPPHHVAKTTILAVTDDIAPHPEPGYGPPTGATDDMSLLPR